MASKLFKHVAAPIQGKDSNVLIRNNKFINKENVYKWEKKKLFTRPNYFLLSVQNLLYSHHRVSDRIIHDVVCNVRSETCRHTTAMFLFRLWFGAVRAIQSVRSTEPFTEAWWENQTEAFFQTTCRVTGLLVSTGNYLPAVSSTNLLFTQFSRLLHCRHKNKRLK